MRPRIAVVGSINLDLVSSVHRLPKPGETLLSRSFAQYPGGKGANQAVAAARMGGDVSLFGAVGDDSTGDRLLDNLRNEGIRIEGVGRTLGLQTGVACILVSGNGENVIAYTPGANAALPLDFVKQSLKVIRASDVLLLQLETPMPIIRALLQELPKVRPLVILDPAPSQALEKTLLSHIHILTPNRGELRTLTGIEDVEIAAGSLISEGIEAVVCTLGVEGSCLITRDRTCAFPAFPVDAVDTTAAGDAFAGTLAVELARGEVLDVAIRTANAAGALAASRYGAQTSIPTRAEADEFLGRMENPCTTNQPVV